MRVLAFGESSTQGFWDTEGGWVARLQKYYDAKQVKDLSAEQPRIMNLGISGAGTDKLLERFENESRARQNEKGLAFIFSIGGNNSSEENGKLRRGPEDYKSDMEKLLNLTRKFSDKTMFIGFHACDETRTTPVAWANIYFRNKNRKQYEDITAGFCKRNDIAFVPIFDIFHTNLEHGEEILAHDGLHPNDAGHELLFQLVRPALDKLLH